MIVLWYIQIIAALWTLASKHFRCPLHLPALFWIAEHNSNAVCLWITDSVHGRISVINVLYNNAAFGRYIDCVSCGKFLVHILGYGGRLAGACFLLIICQTLSHTHFCCHTLVPLSIRHIPLIMKPGSLRELEGHGETGVKMILRALHEVQ